MPAPSSSSVLRVTVEDLMTGETQTSELPAGEYVVVTTVPAYVAKTATHLNGTHVLTVKGRTQP